MLAYNVFTATSIELNRRTLLTPLRTFMRCNVRAVSDPPTGLIRLEPKPKPETEPDLLFTFRRTGRELADTR